MSDANEWSNEPGADRSKRPGWPADPVRVQRALLRGKSRLIGFVIGGAVLGFVVAKVFIGLTYTSQAVLKYEGDLQIAGIQGSSGFSIGPAADALGRQQVLSEIREKTDFQGTLKMLSAYVQYKTDIRAQTVSIRGYADSPKGAAEFVRTVVDVFLDYHRGRQARRIEQEIARVRDRIEGAEREAEEARRRYNEFRERHGIANLSKEQESVVESAAELLADAELAASEVRGLEARVQSLESQLATTPKTSIVSSGTSPEQAAYDRLRQQLASARASLSDDHPQVQALQHQVERLRAQLRSGGSSSGLVGSNATFLTVESELRQARAELATVRERQKGLEAMAQRAKERAESFSGLEGELSALLAEVDVNESLVKQLRATEAALEDALERTPSGFTILDPGAVPEYPLKSSRKITFVAIVVLSGLLGLCLVLWREFRGLRLRTPSEIAFWGNGPVVGTTPWPADPDGLDELVAGLDDFVPDARGTYLVVSGLPADAALAETLAHRMNQDWFVDTPLEATAPLHNVSSPPAAHAPGPPPSGPYPVGGARTSSPSAPAPQPATALALRPRPVQLVERRPVLQLEAWNGPPEGQALRRAARLADRVLVLIRSGNVTPFTLQAIRRRLGRETGIGYLVVDLPRDLESLPDRVGPVAQFWSAS